MFHIEKADFTKVDEICLIGAQTFTDAYSGNNTKEDLEAYNLKSFSTQTILEELSNKDTGYYLCYDDNELIGYSKLNFNNPCPALAETNVTELQRIYVLKEYYNKKAGKELMYHAIQLCKSLIYDYLWLGVWKENHRALKFYDSWGFEIIGERGYKVGNKDYQDYYLRKKLN